MTLGQVGDLNTLWLARSIFSSNYCWRRARGGSQPGRLVALERGIEVATPSRNRSQTPGDFEETGNDVLSSISKRKGDTAHHINQGDED